MERMSPSFTRYEMNWLMYFCPESPSHGPSSLLKPGAPLISAFSLLDPAPASPPDSSFLASPPAQGPGTGGDIATGGPKPIRCRPAQNGSSDSPPLEVESPSPSTRARLWRRPLRNWRFPAAAALIASSSVLSALRWLAGRSAARAQAVEDPGFTPTKLLRNDLPLSPRLSRRERR